MPERQIGGLGFTLVELIIVITILAILFTIAIVSFKSYTKDARDGNRVASISNIENGLEISNVRAGKYPEPDKKDGQSLLQTGALSISGTIVEYSYLGIVGDSIARQLSLSKIPTDPLTGDKYTYTRTIDGRKYQIASILENQTSYKSNLVKQANAGNDPYVAKVEGNHKMEVIYNLGGSGSYITVVPSLVFDGSGSNVLNQSGTLLIVDNKSNLPYSPDKSTSLNNTKTADQIIKEVRNNNQATIVTLKLPSGVTLDGSGVLNQWWIPNQANTNWNSYSSGVILASLGAVGASGGADYNLLTAVLNGKTASESVTTTTTTTTSSYNVGNSLMFNGGNTQYLTRSMIAGNTKKWTWSGWVKRGSLSTRQFIFAAGNSNPTGLQFFADDTLEVQLGNNSYVAGTTTVFRDPSAWYHFVISIDTTANTSTGRIRGWVNGNNITWGNNTYIGNPVYPGQDANDGMYIGNSGTLMEIGHTMANTSLKFDGYMSDINFVDSGALDPTSFGQFDSTTGQRSPKAYTGSYGTNGFHLDFSSGSNLGYDSSGRGNNWNLNGGINQDSNQMIDSPTNNFATWNPIDKENGTIEISNGNLKANNNGTSGARVFKSNFGLNTGKWYWEISSTGGYTSAASVAIGVKTTDSKFYGNGNILGNNPNEWGYYAGGTTNNNSTTVTSAIYQSGDNVGIAVDMDVGKIWVSKNGIWQNGVNPSGGTGSLYSNLGGLTVTPAANITTGTNNVILNINFGQGGQSGLNYYSSAGGNFKYAPPTGFKSLSTANLPDPTIKNPKQYFDVLTYTGNGSTQSLTGLSFQPDLLVVKNRTTARSWSWYDSVRGVSSCLSSDSTNAATSYNPSNNSTYGYVSSIDMNGFTAINGSQAHSYANASGEQYVAWNWKKGSGIGVNGPGFDIQIFSGSTGSPITINHSLGSTPKFVVFKDLDANSTHWGTNYLPLGTGYLWLESSASWVSAASGISGNNTTITIGGGATNTGHNYISYLWSEVPGFSKFGSYTGNGSTDGPFIYTGFKPKFIMIKASVEISTSYTSWQILDTSRYPYNTTSTNTSIWANRSYAEGVRGQGSTDSSVGDIDILSNGFKIRSGPYAENNAPGGSPYIYAAFAEAPFKYATAR